MDDDEGPDLRIGQQRGELLGELVLIVCLGWADAENLFELIEDEERVFPVWAGVDELRKCGFVTVLFPVVADAPDVAVGGDFGGWFGVDAGWFPDVEVVFEFRDEAGVDEGAFAGAGGGVEQDEAFGDEAVAEFGDLAVAAEDGIGFG